MKNLKQIKVLSLFLIILLNLALVDAFQLLTVKNIIREEIKQDEVLQIERQIGVLNDEDFSATVDFDLLGDAIGRVELAEESVSLGPGEEKWVDFTLTISEPGNYDGEILAVFKGEGEGNIARSIALSYQLILFINGTETEETSFPKEDETSFLPLVYILLFILLLAFVLLLAFRLKKRGR